MRIKLFFTLIVGFAFYLLSCNSESNEVQKEDTTNGTLYAMGTRSSTPIGEIPEEEKPYPGDPGETTPTPPVEEKPFLELLFTGDDIKSFNTTTGEIVLTDLIKEKLTNPNEKGVYNRLTLYYDEKPLFESVVITTPVSSWMINDLVFFAAIHESKFYFMNGYPEIAKEWDKQAKEEIQKERDENAKKRKAEWDIFIKYLSEVGKILK